MNREIWKLKNRGARRIAAEQRAELETEIAGLQAEAERQAEEAEELFGQVPF